MTVRNRRMMFVGLAAVVVVAAAIIGIAISRSDGKSPSKAPGTAAPPGATGIAGAVTDPAGHPIAGIRVDIYAVGATQPAREASSALDGSFSETKLTPGTYDLYYFASSAQGGWLSGWYKTASSQAQATPVNVSASKTTHVVIQLQHSAAITGKVTDPKGHPVAGVNVWAYVAGTPDIAWEAQSAADGTYSDVNLASGTYDLYYFSPDTWKSGWYKGATSQAGATPVTAVPPNTVRGIDITLQPK